MKSRIWLSSPHMGGNELTYIHEAFESNWIAPLGPNVTEFEIALKQFLNTDKQVAALSSGTAAIHLGLILLGVKAGDEVICQSMTFSASANPIAYQGATPVFIDSETDTWNMCPIHLEQAIKDRITKGKRPKVIIVVHLYGMPANMDKISAIANKYEIPIIEDAAEALGATYKGKNCGTFGEYAALSFNGNKIITTSGGGALVCNNEESKIEAIHLATQARDNAPHYEHSKIGYNYRMSNIVAGIGRGQMEVLASHISLRREMHIFYKELFRNIEGITVFEEPNADYFSNHWLSCILVEETIIGCTREEVRLALLAENIEARPLWKPMHLQPIFKDAPFYGNGTSEQLFEKGLCVPSGSNLSDEDRKRIKETILKFIKK